MISQTETSGGAGQYGFYAVPKALEPKKKYRDIDNQYEDEEELEEEDDNAFATIDDREAANEKQLERDYYVDQAPYPEFKPRERGLDYGVQIERGDLFDFDLEVRPLIEIIVGRSVVSALNELQEEEQKKERRDNLDKYQKMRNAELMVTQRLEAKYKRKQEQTDRRRLQKDLYVKNQKQLGKKILARRNTKQALLGLKNDILNELEDAGYLRSEATSDLKIKYEEWLYEQIMAALNFKEASEKTVERMMIEQEKKIVDEHQKAINEEMARRKTIQDERERVQREERQRKEKKRYRKWRQKLSSQREQDFIKFEELMEHYQQCNNILKYGQLSSGFSNNSAARKTVYIAGGLDNYLLALIQSSGKDLSAQEIEDLLMKVISQSGRDLDISLRQPHFDKIQEVKKRMQEKKNEFMAQKQGEVKDLAQQVSLDLSTLEAAKTSIKSTLHRRFIEAFLSIYLTVQPEKTQQSEGQLTEADKRRLQYANRIVLSSQSNDFLQRLENINEILRVRFEILLSPQNSEAQVKKQEEGKEKQEEEFIDIYDGEGWDRYAKTAKKELNRAEQSAAAYALTPYQNAFVFDQRVMYYLQSELEKVTGLEAGEKLKQYVENLCNVRGQIKKEVPVYDGEIKWDK